MSSYFICLFIFLFHIYHILFYFVSLFLLLVLFLCWAPGPSIKPIFAGPIQSILQPILAYFQAQFRPKGSSSQGAINNPNRGPTEATQAGFVPSSHPLYHHAPKVSLSNQQASGPCGFSHLVYTGQQGPVSSHVPGVHPRPSPSCA